MFLWGDKVLIDSHGRDPTRQRHLMPDSTHLRFGLRSSLLHRHELCVVVVTMGGGILGLLKRRKVIDVWCEDDERPNESTRTPRRQTHLRFGLRGSLLQLRVVIVTTGGGILGLLKDAKSLMCGVKMMSDPTSQPGHPDARLTFDSGFAAVSSTGTSFASSL